MVARICGWCNKNQVEDKYSVYCATCEHQLEYKEYSGIDECDEMDYNERLAAGFAQMQANERPYPYQYYWS